MDTFFCYCHLFAVSSWKFVFMGNMDFQVGDKVSLLDDNAQAYVLEIGAEGWVRIEMDDDFRTEVKVPASKLALCGHFQQYRPHKIKQKDITNKNQSSAKAPKLAQQNLTRQPLEVDLHVEKLQLRNLANEHVLEIQLAKAREVLTENKNKRGLKIILIHGNGKGILRNELIKLLKKNFSTYKVTDASMQKYGTGAIEVQIN
jgi:dsDNA-specific endonuclease/ATPase MutS2